MNANAIAWCMVAVTGLVAIVYIAQMRPTMLEAFTAWALTCLALLTLAEAVVVGVAT